MMRLVSIETSNNDTVVVNTSHICSIFISGNDVVIRMSCGHGITTKFTDVNHAVDYLKRAEYVAEVR